MPMDRPNQVYPPPSQSPTSVPSQMPLWIPDPSIKGISFDQLINQRGIRVIHHKAIPCPNVQTLNTNAHLPDCEFCDDSGIIYYDQKEIMGLFSGNSMEKTFEAHGVWEVGTSVMTFPAEYSDGTQADFNTYDKLIIPDFEVRLWELKEYEPRLNNKQALRYPVTKMEIATSISDGAQKFYQVGVDFNISSDGAIEWIDGKEPDYDDDKEIGETIAYGYFANPVYIVLQSMRELRITQELVNNQKIARRLPQHILVKRDFMVGSGEKLAGSGT